MKNIIEKIKNFFKQEDCTIFEVPGYCPRCEADSIFIRRNSKTGRLVSRQCTKCDWAEKAQNKELVVKLSEKGARVVGDGLIKAKEKDILEVMTPQANLVFIIVKNPLDN